MGGCWLSGVNFLGKWGDLYRKWGLVEKSGTILWMNLETDGGIEEIIFEGWGVVPRSHGEMRGEILGRKTFDSGILRFDSGVPDRVVMVPWYEARKLGRNMLRSGGWFLYSSGYRPCLPLVMVGEGEAGEMGLMHATPVTFNRELNGMVTGIDWWREFEKGELPARYILLTNSHFHGGHEWFFQFGEVVEMVRAGFELYDPGFWDKIQVVDVMAGSRSLGFPPDQAVDVLVGRGDGQRVGVSVWLAKKHRCGL
jgi:hypothetical protein